MKKLSQKEIDRLITKAVKFAKSPEGKRELKKAMEQARRASEKYVEAQCVNPEDLTKPFGPIKSQLTAYS